MKLTKSVLYASFLAAAISSGWALTGISVTFPKTATPATATSENNNRAKEQANNNKPATPEVAAKENNKQPQLSANDNSNIRG